MKPSAALERNRTAIRAAVVRFRAANPRIFGSVLHGTDRDEEAAEHPVVLTTKPGNPNGSEVRFLVDGAAATDLSAYRRAIVLFDGNDPDAVDTARDQWKEAQGEGFEVVYWQQDKEGRWQKKG